MKVISYSNKDLDNKITQEKPDASVNWWATLGISMGVFIFALDVYIVNLALPRMVESLHTSFATIQSVVLSYLLAIAIFVLSVTQLGDIFSKKQLYIIGLIVFTISSLLCGLAPSIGFLLAFRFLQGLGAAFLAGLGTAMIVEVFPPEQRGFGLGIRSAVFGLGLSLGPTVGGLLINLGGWHLIFLVNVPIGIVTSLIVAYFVPPSVVNGTKYRFDIVGSFLLAQTLSCFILSITLLQTQGFGSLGGLTLLIVSAISLVCFLLVETRLNQPMLNLEIFRSLDFSFGLVLRFLVNFVIAGAMFILPFFFELIKHYPTEKIGLLLAVPAIILVLTGPISGTLSDRFGSRVISLIGLVLMAFGCLFLSTFNSELSVYKYIIYIFPYAIGVGMFQSPNNSAIIGTAPKDNLGLASGLLSLSRILGQMLGVPLVGAFFSLVTMKSAQLALNIDVTNAPLEALIFGMQTSFRAIAVLLFTSVIVATFVSLQSCHMSSTKLSDIDSELTDGSGKGSKT
ncbi:MFS transporter [Nostoc sp. CHAB 5836]|uniref:MFS transporter n=1 Tax=Nostoc sp. CHAB 5836 TaxID=2780404 RepID=UPI001E44C0B0|nr:MFS transporter [Nostoc sp. CHAB 5836]MCC5616350.1 MFS transporter [Nostoc sp. CHAB 5836]